MADDDRADDAHPSAVSIDLTISFCANSVLAFGRQGGRGVEGFDQVRSAPIRAWRAGCAMAGQSSLQRRLDMPSMWALDLGFARREILRQEQDGAKRARFSGDGQLGPLEIVPHLRGDEADQQAEDDAERRQHARRQVP